MKKISRYILTFYLRDVRHIYADRKWEIHFHAGGGEMFYFILALRSFIRWFESHPHYVITKIDLRRDDEK